MCYCVIFWIENAITHPDAISENRPRIKITTSVIFYFVLFHLWYCFVLKIKIFE